MNAEVWWEVGGGRLKLISQVVMAEKVRTFCSVLFNQMEPLRGTVAGSVPLFCVRSTEIIGCPPK